ncbi:5488_t:CDS:2 [Dentiscutata heterogama]|uniref:5488_t:CDS:1 n=1 Tax=Dentiscutata heterogama TaxID=1316150 RepID=A0ACA9KD51_9GLOM|nr:5488_t:CDS:2 [Dentiscutata heterogama]
MDIPKLRTRKRYKKGLSDIINPVDTNVIENFSPQEYSLSFTNSEADETSKEMNKEVDEEVDEEINENTDDETNENTDKETNENTDEKTDEEAEAEVLADEELEQTDNYFQEFTHKLLVVDAEEGQINDDVLEEESSEFEGFDGDAYEDLSKILKHPKFLKEEVITNIRRFRKWRYKLPLLQVRQHDVPICEKKVPSTLLSTKKAFVISPLVHLEHVLNNPTLMPKMYFGHGVVEEEKSEFWHGDLWQESPLFGEHQIKCKDGG